MLGGWPEVVALVLAGTVQIRSRATAVVGVSAAQKRPVLLQRRNNACSSSGVEGDKHERESCVPLTAFGPR
eukprot:scaffold1331_cov58-Phaeocystis_antarctica.AAC.2